MLNARVATPKFAVQVTAAAIRKRKKATAWIGGSQSSLRLCILPVAAATQYPCRGGGGGGGGGDLI